MAQPTSQLSAVLHFLFLPPFLVLTVICILHIDFISIVSFASCSSPTSCCYMSCFSTTLQGSQFVFLFLLVIPFCGLLHLFMWCLLHSPFFLYSFRQYKGLVDAAFVTFANKDHVLSHLCVSVSKTLNKVTDEYIFSPACAIFICH